MSDELKNAVNAMREATEEIKKREDANGQGVAELKAIVEKANAAIDKQEEKNAELMKELGEKQKAAEEMKERMDELEEKSAKLGRGANAKEEKQILLAEESKAMKEWAEGKETEKKYLRSDSNVEGGFLMDEAYDDMILKKITETSPMRSVCRTKRIDALQLGMALRETLVEGFWTKEGTDFQESNSTYSAPEIQVHSSTMRTKVTNQALLGGRWSMETEITGDFAERRAQLEGAGFVSGNGVSKPRGFLDAGAAVPTVDSSGSSTYTFDDLIKLTGELKTGYNPIYGLNRKELAFIRTLKDSAGNYIWRAGNVGAAVPNQINGVGYIEIPDMPDKATDATPIVYADFNKLYTIVDAFQAIMLRNPYKFDGFVQFSMQSFVGGDVVLPEAAVLLKTVA